MKAMFSKQFAALAGTAALLAMISARPTIAGAQTNFTPPAINNLHAGITRPLSLADALDTALQQSAAILKAKNDLESTYGVIVQTRAIALPKLTADGNYTHTDPNAIENFLPSSQPNKSWNASFKIVQSIYEGGKLGAAIRAARLTKEQALLQYQTVVSDTLLATRVAYYDVLLAAQQIIVNEASVNLLAKELDDQHRRYDAGTVPRFNVLRAEVAVANARPPLIRARNEYRIAKNNLSNLLGYNLPPELTEDIPLQLTDTLAAEPYQVDLPAAIQQALEKRTELAALRKAEQLQDENLINARSGYQPSVQAFAGYGWRSVQFTQPTTLDHDIAGWSAGAQLSWNLFDGFLTKGKVMQAKAQREKARTDLDDKSRQVELQVRTAYSTFIEAREVLDSQQKVQEQADEALRLARARTDAGTGTQLEVLDAETSLTQARTTQIQALHDYAAARAKLERATGQDMIQARGK